MPLNNFTDKLRSVVYPQCQLSQEIGYVMYSAFRSFYIPSCIMVFVYIKIYYAARERARRVINKPGMAKRISRRFTKSSNPNNGQQAAAVAAAAAAANRRAENISTISNNPNGCHVSASPIHTTVGHSSDGGAVTEVTAVTKPIEVEVDVAKPQKKTRFEPDPVKLEGENDAFLPPPPGGATAPQDDSSNGAQKKCLVHILSATSVEKPQALTGRPSDPCEEVVAPPAMGRPHAYGACASVSNNGTQKSQPRTRRSIGVST